MPNERPLKVFLCHAHSDKNAVSDLYQRLIKDGVDAWLDKGKLLPDRIGNTRFVRQYANVEYHFVCYIN